MIGGGSRLIAGLCATVLEKRVLSAGLFWVPNRVGHHIARIIGPLTLPRAGGYALVVVLIIVATIVVAGGGAS